MHTVDLGIWVHMLHSVHYTYDAAVRPFSASAESDLEEVWGTLSSRLQGLDSTDSMFSLNSFKGNFMIRIRDEVFQSNAKHKTFQAWEHQLLMQVSKLT